MEPITSTPTTQEKYAILRATQRLDIERAIAEQAECAAYIRDGGLDMDGAWRGLLDNLAEECLIRMGAAQ